MPADYFAPALGMLWKVVVHYGLEPEIFFAQAGISRQQISDVNLRIPNPVIQQLWAQAHEQINDPCLGLRAAEYFHPSHLGSLGYAWLASSSLRNALERLSRYIRLLTEEREILISEQGEQVYIETRLEPMSNTSPLRADISMAVLMTMCRWNFGASLTPIKVLLKRDANDQHQQFENYFCCPITYNASSNTLILLGSEVDAALTSANPILAQLNDQFLIDYISKLDQDDLITQLKKIITEHISEGAPCIELVAQRLHVSVRTLQRRLKTKDTHYKKLIDDTRYLLTQNLLRDQSRSLTEIAFNTGFSTQSSFSNAVKRWTGLSPKHYRQKLCDNCSPNL